MVQAGKPPHSRFRQDTFAFTASFPPENEAGDIVVTDFVMVLTFAFTKVEKLHILSS
jgi:hypothetical protein